jgi:hypothetical protein
MCHEHARHSGHDERSCFGTPDEQLTVALGRLATSERQATAGLIRHLAEFDARRLYEPAGFSCTFKYCRKVLRLSEDAAYNRIEAVRAAQRHPEILDRLATGSLSVTTARMLGRHLTDENRVDRAFGPGWRRFGPTTRPGTTGMAGERSGRHDHNEPSATG